MKLFLIIMGWLCLALGLVLFNIAFALAGGLFLVCGACVAGWKDAEPDHDSRPSPRSRTYQSERRALSSRTTSGANSTASGVGRLKGDDRNGLTLVHSPSAVKLYKDCPHKYMRLRVKKDVEDETGPAGEKGNRIHDALRSYIAELKHEMKANLEEEGMSVLDRLEKRILRYIPRSNAIKALAADDEEIKMFMRGCNIVDEMMRHRTGCGSCGACGREAREQRPAPNLSGPHSIRINDQWRIVFRWTGEGPAQVAIVDYH